MIRLRSPLSLLVALWAVLGLAACGGGSAPEVPTATAQSIAPAVEATATTSAPPATATTEPTPTEVAGNLEDVQAATVQVIVQGSQFLEEFIGSGSGVIYDPTGLVVTNNHVVEGAAIVQVQVEGESSPLSARVLGKSPCDDLAVLQITTGGTFPVAILDNDIRVGDDVFAIGYPLGDPVQSTTKGIVSKADIAIPTGFADYLHAIQTDAAINPGNSGGPLATRDGRVIGINSAGLDSAQGTNFAISMDYARPLIDRLAAGERIGWIGLNAAPLPSDLAAEFGIALEPGLFVYAVDSGSPADEIGIQEGDFVTSIEGVAVGADGTLKDYCDVLRSHGPDDVLDVSVIREGQRFAGQLNGRALAGGESLALGGGDDGGEEGGSTGSGGTDGSSPVTFIEFSDDTGRITVQLPDIWETQSDELVLTASPDMQGWLDSFGGGGSGASDPSASTSGFYIQALDQEGTVDMTTVQGFLDNAEQPTNCALASDEDVGDYDDGVYQGRYNLLTCDEGSYVTLFAFDPDAPTYLIWVEGYLVNDEDIEIFGNALDTFLVAAP